MHKLCVIKLGWLNIVVTMKATCKPYAIVLKLNYPLGLSESQGLISTEGDNSFQPVEIQCNIGYDGD